MVLPDDVRALLDGPNTAHFASVLADGAPHSAPVWVGLEQERIAVHLALIGQGAQRRT